MHIYIYIYNRRTYISYMDLMNLISTLRKPLIASWVGKSFVGENHLAVS